MPLTRRSKLKEVWRHPVGNQVLQSLLRQLGRDESWLERPLVASMPLQNIDRVAGAGFCDMLLEMAAHGPSGPPRVADECKNWWKEAVIYQIFVPSFMDADHDGVGDLTGVLQRLPYLEKLGVDVLYLWPLADEDACGAVKNYRTLCADCGDMADFEELAQAVHARGMKLVIGLDIAATSEEHEWFQDAFLQGGGASYVLQPGRADAPPNNWVGANGIDAWKWVEDAGMWGLQLAGRGKLDLNWDNAAIRKEISDVLLFWHSAGADGFFFGQVNLLSKNGLEDGKGGAAMLAPCGYEKYAYGPRLHRYLRELRAALPAPVMLAGDMYGVSTEMAKQFTAEEGAELDMLLDTSHLATRIRPRAEEGRVELADVKRHYMRWQTDYINDGWMPLIFESPHTARLISRTGASALYRGILSKQLALWMLTLRGTPMLFQGQELGLPNSRYNSPEELCLPASQRTYVDYCERLEGDAATAFSRLVMHMPEQNRTTMPWNANPSGGFSGASPWMRTVDGAEYLNAAAQMDDAHSVWHFYQKCIALRKNSTCLIYGNFHAVFAKNKKVFCYFRIYDGEKWYVEMNITEREVARPGRILRTQKLEVSNYDVPAKWLRPYEANLYRCE